MDPLSAASGAIGIASLFSLTFDVLDKVETYKSAKQTRDQLFAQIGLAKTQIRIWARGVGIEDGELKEQHHYILDNPQDRESIRVALAMINNLFVDVAKVSRYFSRALSGRRYGPGVLLGRISGSNAHPRIKISTIFEKVKWTLSEPKLIKSVDALGKLVDRLDSLVPRIEREPPGEQHLGISDTERSSSTRLHLPDKTLKDQKQEVLRVVRNGDLTLIDEVLDTPRLQDELADYTRTRLDGTCDWIFDNETYRGWLSTKSERASFLWLYAPTGHGKTILSSHIITSLEKTFAPLVFHFFFSSFHEYHGGRSDDVIRSLISQIAEYDDSGLALVNKYLKQNTFGRLEDLANVWETFGNIVSQLGRCFFVLDGLDEYSSLETDRREFLESLKARLSGTSSMIIITSSDLPDIRAQLEPIDLANNMLNLYCHEITKIDTHLDRSSCAHEILKRKLGEERETLRHDLASRMTDRSGGMFLWLEMMSKGLRKRQNKSSLKQAIDHAPDLRTIYESNWQRINQQNEIDKARSLEILKWCILSLRPLTVGELAIALAVPSFAEQDEIDLDDLSHPIDEEYIEEEIRQLCGLFIDVRTSKDGEESALMVVRLAHLSVKEYLRSVMFEQHGDDDATSPRSVEPLVHLELAKVCLRYLCCRKTIEAQEFTDTFREYALEKWLSHRKISNLEDPHFDFLLLRFFNSNNANFTEWAASLETDEKALANLDDQEYGSVGPLYIAALLGYESLLKSLLGRDTPEVNNIGGIYGTALQAACAKGNTGIITLLLDSGANVNVKSEAFGNALGAAAYYGHYDVVLELLNKDARVNEVSSSNMTPLYHAARLGHTDIVKLLLDHTGDPDIASEIGWTPLYAASYRGHVEIVQILLQREANIELAGTGGWTPLLVASEQGHTQIVGLLLEKHADIEAANSHGRTSLFVASDHGNLKIIELLLEKKANVNKADKDGCTALLVASGEGQTPIVKLLLENGADITATTRGGRTSVFMASSGGHLDTLELLLGKGASIKTSMADGWTPLISASAQGNPQVVKLLLQSGADINASNKFGKASIHLASDYGHDKIVQVLVDHGADIENPSNIGRTPLLMASRCGHVEVVRILLNQGANFNTSEANAWTPLLHATYRGHLEVVRLLLDRGAEINVSDGVGYFPLYLAALEGNLEMAQLLLEKGADTIMERPGGDTSLFVAARGGHLDLVELLDRSEASLNAENKASSPRKDNLRRTLPRYAARGGNVSVFDYLIKDKPVIIKEDEFGRGLLEYACMSGSSEMIKRVLEVYEANKLEIKTGSWSAWHWACVRGSPEALEALANANIKSAGIHTSLPPASWSPIDLAVYWNNTNIISDDGRIELENYSWSSVLEVQGNGNLPSSSPYRANSLDPGIVDSSGGWCDGCFFPRIYPYFQCHIVDYCFMCKYDSKKSSHSEHEHEWQEMKLPREERA